MRILALPSVQPGMILGRPVYGREGQVLLQKGIVIKPQYISYLERLGIYYIYVKDSRMGEGIKDVVSEEVRQEARSLMNKTIKSIDRASSKEKGIIFQDKKILAVVKKVIDNLLENGDLVIQLADLRGKDDYLFAHSVQCSIISTLVARQMGYSREHLQIIATGAILHDIGMAFIPESILHKPGDLTKDEYETVKQHPFLGHEVFKKTSLYSSRAGSILLQHHERKKGQGYPKGLEGDAIYPLAQIVAIADMYDSLTSHRPFREAFKPHEAVELLQGLGHELFDLKILREFLSIIAAYPVGTHVVLSNGESGLVLSNRPGFTLCPMVKVLYIGEDLAPHPDPYDLDLSEITDLTVVDVLP